MTPLPSDRGAQAARRVRAQGGSAMDAALEQISVYFDNYHGWHTFKSQCRSRLRYGPTSPENRATYRLIMLDVNFPGTLEQAISCVELKFREDMKRQRQVNYWKHGWIPRTNAGPLAELRLILRFIRRHHAHRWEYIFDNITLPAWSTAVVHQEAAE